MVKHELPTQPEADLAPVELHPSKDHDPLSNPDPDVEIVAYDITQSDQKIGQLELKLDRPDRLVAIDWFSIDEEQRGQGYGKQARQAAINLILSKYSWASTIESTLDNRIALKNAISTPIPANWDRKFKGLGSYFFETVKPEEALDYISPDVHVSWVLEKNDEPVQ